MLWLSWLTLATAVVAWSPTNSYAPGKMDCPTSKDIIREANQLRPDEADWVSERHKNTDQELLEFLKRANMSDFDPEDFLKNKANRSLTIGLAFSGGGYRAMLAGAGELSALDSRTTNANDKGLGGLLQSATYITGLSGGNWMVGSLVLNNWTSVQDIVDNKKQIWDISHSIINIGGWNPIKMTKYFTSLNSDLDDKENAGFNTSFTDVWGRALSWQFFDDDDHGAAVTWSGIQDSDPFKNHEMPFPIVVADGRTPGTYIISENSTVFEFSPYELGSWDPSLYQFVDVKYLGSNTTNGSIEGDCIGGFDNGGFVMGTSSSLFNQFILQLNTTDLPDIVKSIANKYLSKWSRKDEDIAVYSPNPFYKTNKGTVGSIAQNETLYLCDGGEDGQNVPLHPLIQPQRKLDVIFAYDNSADTNDSWPDGTSLIKTYQRMNSSQGNGTVFPPVPDAKSFINLNLTARPAFFGCDAKNLSNLFTNNKQPNYTETDVPLIVYTANRPFSFSSNTSTFDLKYDVDKRNSMIRNGFEVASRNNLTLDSEWPACVGCAIIRREQERQGIEQSEQCKKCFEQYCWNGSFDDKEPDQYFSPTGTTNEASSAQPTKPKKGAAAALANPLDTLLWAVMGVALWWL
ncbi:hypothetical protein DIURU_004772 [Diutina rugosa]|uniref:Lysophospholipase n=1 Tax=Diutina rugosa TaxID=5481 RepID=A0A642UF56_DIURU|nr:uncharacterized protein DIURU_004772 [Diutina rugosa]KAA8897919.1 hypothetical protein DIURU_004772 [Diutina rugosa]